MDGEAKYNFQELERCLLLANTNDETERELYLDKAEEKVAELKRIFEERE